MWHGPEVPASYTLSSGSYGYCYKALSLLSSGWSWIHFFLSSQCCSQHGLYCCQTHWNCIVWFKADSGRNFSPHRKSSDCFALFQSKPTPVFKKKKVNVQLHVCKLSTMYMCLQSVKNIPSILLGYIYKPPGTFLSPGSLEIVFKWSLALQGMKINLELKQADSWQGFSFTLPYATISAIQGRCLWLWKRKSL